VEAAGAPSATPATGVAPAPTAAPPTAVPTPTTAVADVTGAFGEPAVEIVRAYLAAVERGDVNSAYALLAAPPKDGTLPEIGIVDSTTRITHIQARGLADAATVNLDLQTRSGAYSAQYTVHRTSSGDAMIVQQSIIKL